MKNGWTGAQYSIYRVIFGVCLFVKFVSLIGTGVTLPLIVAAVAALFFIIGLYDRVAAVVMCGALAWLRDLALLLPGLLLVAHVLLPPAPFWSFAARNRVDPRGNWSMPRPVFAAAWIVLALQYAYSGYTRWPSWLGIVELLFVPLALFARVRPWLWLAMLLLHLDRGFGLIALHLFTFDPAWIRGVAPATTDRVLYDGSCGLCHRSVRFLIAEDTAGTQFVYVPQEGGGATVIVEAADGRTLTKTAAVIHLMRRLGGMWRLLAVPFALIPRPLRDAGYDVVARVRYRVFGKTKEACPLMPPDLRSRFTV